MGRLNVEVVFATKDAADIVTLSVASGAQAIDALWASGLAERYPENDMRNPVLGIFGNRVAPDTRLKNGDRVEVYRPLSADPKEVRRAKASSRQRTKR